MHEVLTERRDDDVDLGELLDRLRAMLVQGLVAGKTVEAELEPVELAGHRATALALVFSELFQNALEHGGSDGHGRAAAPERRRPARRSPTTAPGIADERGRAPGSRSSARSSATSSAARWSCAAASGTRAEVVFPA